MFMQLTVADGDEGRYRTHFVQIDEIRYIAHRRTDDDHSVQSIVVLKDGTELLCTDTAAYYHSVLKANNLMLKQ